MRYDEMLGWEELQTTLGHEAGEYGDSLGRAIRRAEAIPKVPPPTLFCEKCGAARHSGTCEDLRAGLQAKGYRE